MPHKAPNRPRYDVSQCFNDGMVTIYSETDAARGGYLPEPVRDEKLVLAYQERKLGIQRYYEAKQNQIHVERVIRVQMPPMPITNQEVAMTEDGRFYRIDLVQKIIDSYPPCLDLTLTAYKQTEDGREEVVFDGE